MRESPHLVPSSLEPDPAWSAVGFSADGTIEGPGIDGWWRTRGDALAVHLRRRGAEWTAVFLVSSPSDAGTEVAARVPAHEGGGTVYAYLRRAQ